MITSDIQTLEPGAKVQLFTLDASNIAGGVVLHFHGYQQVGSITWQGVAYTAWPIQAEGFAKTSEGQQPAPKLSVGNVDGSISALCIQLDDLVGATLTRHLTLGKYLDAVNFPPLPLVAPAFVSRASTATYTDASGVIQIAAVNVARFDFDPVTHAANGLLLEPAATNLLRQSGRCDTSPWATDPNAGTTSLTAVTAPDGSASTVMVTRDTSAGYRYQTPAVSAATYTFSTYVKQGNSANNNVFVQIGNGFRGYYNFATKKFLVSAGCTAIAITQKDVGNGWSRLSIAASLPAGNTVCAIGLASATGGIYDVGSTVGTGHYFWGAQLESGAVVTTLIPTTTAALTRAADISTMFSPGGNPSADASQEFPPEIWFIEQKTGETNEVVEFELMSALDFQGQMLPARQIIANLCSFTYKGPYCAYVPGAMFDANDASVTNPALDVCSKRLSGCRARFGATQVLNFGGFPAAGLIRN